MNENEAATFLFAIAKEIKRSYETPVILLTKVDYSGQVYKMLLEMSRVLMIGAEPQRVLDAVGNQHREWLSGVRDLKAFQRRLTTLPRELVFEAITFTIMCIQDLSSNFQSYFITKKPTLTKNEINLMKTDIELIQEMEQSVVSALRCKYNCFQNTADSVEFTVKVEFELQELLNWWDRLHDNLSMQLCAAMELDKHLLYDLTKTLKRMVDSIKSANDISTKEFLKEIGRKGEVLSSMLRTDPSHELEIQKVREQIKILDDRIQRLESGSSAAVMALQHKKMYLIERLKSLEDLKQAMLKLKESSQTSIASHYNGDNSPKEFRIFNHLLPDEKCVELIEGLLIMWDTAISSNRHRKSVITILSVGDIKEEFSDYLGVYTHDKYGRKIYEKAGTDNFFQANERNELVLVNDDEKHVYFYDAVGRYYLQDAVRIYKATARASEYLLKPIVGMIKLKEIVGGIEYGYDNLGRFYTNDKGQRIYRSENSDTEYQNDGFGNLISINDYCSEPCTFDCSLEPVVSESSKYLQRVVGKALTKCLADLVLYLPTDPILYLADRLEKYRENMEFSERHRKDVKEMMAMRELVKEDNLENTMTSDGEAYSLKTIEEQSESSFSYK